MKNESVCKNVSKTPPSKSFSCDFCYYTFTRKDSLTKHVNGRCKMKEYKTNDIYTKLLKKLESHEKEIDTLKKQSKISKTINNNIQNNNYITLNPFGDENIKKLTNKIWTNIFRLNYGSIMKLIEYTHFNEKFPENSNVYISNIKSDHAMVYDGKKWNLHPRDETIDNLIDNKADCLENKFFEIIDSLDNDLQKKFKEFLDNSDDTDYNNQLKNDIKLLLYNKRDIPMKLIKNKDQKVIYPI
jgi:hypothetical protein